jgi:murein DD-endopeptidase MepM/ murein hydrolase activator NlpD
VKPTQSRLRKFLERRAAAIVTFVGALAAILWADGYIVDYRSSIGNHRLDHNRDAEIDALRTLEARANALGLPYAPTLKRLVEAQSRGQRRPIRPMGLEGKRGTSLSAVGVASDSSRVAVLHGRGRVVHGRVDDGLLTPAWAVELVGFPAKSVGTALWGAGRYAAAMDRSGEVRMWNGRTGRTIWRHEWPDKPSIAKAELTFAQSEPTFLALSGTDSGAIGLTGRRACVIRPAPTAGRPQLVDDYYVSTPAWMRPCSKTQCEGFRAIDLRSCKWVVYSSLLGSFRDAGRPGRPASANYDSSYDETSAPGTAPSSMQRVVVAATNDGSGIAVARYRGGSYGLINLYSGQPLGEAFRTASAPTSIAYSPEANLVVLGDSTGVITLWDAVWHVPLARLGVVVGEMPITFVRFGNEGKTLTLRACADACRVHTLSLVLDESIAVRMILQVLRASAHVRHRFGATLPQSPEVSAPSTEARDKGPPAREAQNFDQAITDAEQLQWHPPARGTVVSEFSETTKGVDIAGTVGDSVFAASDGVVAFAGSGLRGYGLALLIKHGGRDILTVYAHNSKLLAREGQTVRGGEVIAYIGSSEAESPKLHFEVRVKGKPVDPRRFIELGSD